MPLHANEFKNEINQKVNANNIWCSQAVTHPSTDQTQRCLTSLIGREVVLKESHDFNLDWCTLLYINLKWKSIVGIFEGAVTPFGLPPDWQAVTFLIL